MLEGLDSWAEIYTKIALLGRYLKADPGDGDTLPFAVSSLHALGRGGEADPGPGGGRRPRDASAVGGGAPGGPEGAGRPPAAPGAAPRLHQAPPAPGHRMPRPPS